MTAILDYKINSSTVANAAGGGYPLTFNAGTVSSGGPGSILGETGLSSFISLTGQVATGQVDLTNLNIDTNRFHARIVFRVPSSLIVPAPDATNPQMVLLFCDRPYFILQIVSVLDTTISPAGAALKIQASCSNFYSLWTATEIYTHKATVTRDVWHVADLVYDFDTLGIFLDQTFVGLTAFENVLFTPSPTNSYLRVGGNLLFGHGEAVLGHFGGDVAGLRLENDLQITWENLLDAQRQTAQWFLTLKRNSLKPANDIGDSLGPPALQLATGSWIQHFQTGTLMYHTAASGAYLLRGSIERHYNSLSTDAQNILGYLLGDDVATSGGNGTKSLFSNGGIYCRTSDLSTVEVTGQIFADYEASGGTGIWGFPSFAARSIADGWYQEFYNGDSTNPVFNHFYWHSGAPAAYSMHQPIGGSYGAVGGPKKYGWPVQNESARNGANGTNLGVRQLRCQSCVYFWAPAVGPSAFEVNGDIMAKYLSLGGPDSQLGLPISNEQDLINHDGTVGGRISYFQNGAITWKGSADTIVVCLPFQLEIGLVNTSNSEGFLGGSNDIYVTVHLAHGLEVLYDKRYPDSRYFPSADSVIMNQILPPTLTPGSLPFYLTITVWDWDSGTLGGDDLLGQWIVTLQAIDSWFLDALIVHSSALQPHINDITLSIRPVTAPGRVFTEAELFWSMPDRPTPTVTYDEYAAAFTDVDDWYTWYVQNCSKRTNSFGMCLESINVRQNRDTIFAAPLNQYHDWDACRNEIEIMNLRQLNASTVNYTWNVRITNNGDGYDNLKQLWNHVRQKWLEGDPCILGITCTPSVVFTQDWDPFDWFVLPFAFQSNGALRTMSVHDPAFPLETRTFTIDTSTGIFSYNGTLLNQDFHGTNDDVKDDALNFGAARSSIYYVPRSVLDRGRDRDNRGKLTGFSGGGEEHDPPSDEGEEDLTIAGSGALSLQEPQTNVNLLDTGPEQSLLRSQGHPRTGVYFRIPGNFGNDPPTRMLHRRGVLWKPAQPISGNIGTIGHPGVGILGPGALELLWPDNYILPLSDLEHVNVAFAAQPFRATLTADSQGVRSMTSRTASQTAKLSCNAVPGQVLMMAGSDQRGAARSFVFSSDRATHATVNLCCQFRYNNLWGNAAEMALQIEDAGAFMVSSRPALSSISIVLLSNPTPNLLGTCSLKMTWQGQRGPALPTKVMQYEFRIGSGVELRTTMGQSTGFIGLGSYGPGGIAGGGVKWEMLKGEDITPPQT